MRSIMLVVAVLLAACGGSDDERTLEEWLSVEVPDVESGDVDCVASELRADRSAPELDEWTTLDVSSWSEDDYLANPEVSEALASASFACEGAGLSD